MPSFVESARAHAAAVEGHDRTHLVRLLTSVLVLASLFALRVAKPVAVPLAVAVILGFVLSPIALYVERRGVPRHLAAGLVVCAIVTAVVYGIYSLSYPAADWSARLPSLVRDLTRTARALNLAEPIQSVAEATREVASVATGQSNDAPVVQLDDGGLEQVALDQIQGFVVTFAVALVFLFFLLADRDRLLLKAVRRQSSLARKKRVVRTAERLRKEISAYLLTITLINVALGCVVGVAMRLFGMPNPALWGVMAAFLNFVPYVGSLLGICIVTLVAMTALPTAGMIVGAPLAYFACTAAEGYFVTPLVVGARLELSPLAILLALLVWSWLWGIAGALLAVPLLTSFKIACDGIDSLAGISEMLAP